VDGAIDVLAEYVCGPEHHDPAAVLEFGRLIVAKLSGKASLSNYSNILEANIQSLFVDSSELLNGNGTKVASILTRGLPLPVGNRLTGVSESTLSRRQSLEKAAVADALVDLHSMDVDDEISSVRC
jgi:hypothetical protein